MGGWLDGCSGCCYGGYSGNRMEWSGRDSCNSYLHMVMCDTVMDEGFFYILSYLFFKVMEWALIGIMERQRYLALMKISK